MNKLVATIATTILATQSTTLLAQDRAAPSAPMEAGQVGAAVRYALPFLLDGFSARCGGVLSPEGYFAVNADRLQKKFTESADANWAEARDVIRQMVAKDGGRDTGAEVMANLPDEALKPFVGGMLQAMIATEMKEKDCMSVERVLETLDPLPADNLAALIGLVVELSQKDKAAKNARAHN